MLGHAHDGSKRRCQVIGAVARDGLPDDTSTQVVAAPSLNQIEPFQIMTKAKDLPDQTFEDRTFVF
jgi:hypothetical protein